MLQAVSPQFTSCKSRYSVCQKMTHKETLRILKALLPAFFLMVTASGYDALQFGSLNDAKRLSSTWEFGKLPSSCKMISDQSGSASKA